jgi:hypothetical protein
LNWDKHVMARVIEFETPRLRMRQWRDADREPFAAMNADPPSWSSSPRHRVEPPVMPASTAWQSQFAASGWSNWAAELIRVRAVHRFRRAFRASPSAPVFAMR